MSKCVKAILKIKISKIYTNYKGLKKCWVLSEDEDQAFSDMWCSVVYRYQHFRGTCYPHLQTSFFPEDEGSSFFTNVGTYLPT
jgi:hypothetical protein